MEATKIENNWIHTPELSEEIFNKLKEAGLHQGFKESSYKNDCADSVIKFYEETGDFIQVYLPNSKDYDDDQQEWNNYCVQYSTFNGTRYITCDNVESVIELTNAFIVLNKYDN